MMMMILEKLAANKLAPYFDSHVRHFIIQHTLANSCCFLLSISRTSKTTTPKILLPEGEEPRIIEAAIEAYQRQVAHPILLGRREVILDIVENMGLEWNAHIIIMDPDEQRSCFIDPLVRMRAHKGMDQHTLLHN